MKTGMLLGLAMSSLLAVASVSAMEAMSTSTMMPHDTMLTGSVTMDHPIMIHKINTTMMSTASLAANRGYNWAKDRKSLAKKLGIKMYTGSSVQNLMIRKHLLDMYNAGTMMANDTMMSSDTMMAK